MKFKVGDKIRYSLISNVTIIDEDDVHFILKDKNGNIKKVYKELVNKYSRLEG